MRNRFALWRMYGKMYRAGKRTVRKMLRKGANPYLKMLRDLIDEDSRAECIELGTMDIPTIELWVSLLKKSRINTLMISYLYHDLMATLHRSGVNYIGFSLATKLPGVRLPATNIWVSFT